MTADADEMIHAHIDGTLDPDGEAALAAWLAASPENAKTFAAVALLHDQLRNVVASERAIPGVVTASDSGAVPAPRLWTRLRPLVVTGSMVATLSVILAIWMSVAAPLSASGELSRLIEAPAHLHDRTYRISSRDPSPDLGDDRQPPLDGALLYVRTPDRYVLARRFPDGHPFVTGSDGERGWSVKPDGAVRVSSDPLRFRGPLPGNQHGIPFVDPRSDLRQLRDSYSVSTLPTGSDGLRGLAFEKRSQEVRGPRRVEVWYDPQTFVVRRMDFMGLPRARGGPAGASVELVEERDLGPDFFRHESHHGSDRKVVEED